MKLCTQSMVFLSCTSILSWIKGVTVFCSPLHTYSRVANVPQQMCDSRILCHFGPWPLFHVFLTNVTHFFRFLAILGYDCEMSQLSYYGVSSSLYFFTVIFKKNPDHFMFGLLILFLFFIIMT